MPHDGKRRLGGAGGSSVEGDGCAGLGFRLVLDPNLLYPDNYKTLFYASSVPVMRERRFQA